MSFATKYNKVTFEVDTKGLEFTTLEELYNNNTDLDIRFTAVFFSTKGRYGEQPIAVLATEQPDGVKIDGNKRLVSLPHHTCDDMHNAVNEFKEQITEGMCGFRIYTYNSKVAGKTCYSVNWVDLPSLPKISIKGDDLPF